MQSMQDKVRMKMNINDLQCEVRRGVNALQDIMGAIHNQELAKIAAGQELTTLYYRERSKLAYKATQTERSKAADAVWTQKLLKISRQESKFLHLNEEKACAYYSDALSIIAKARLKLEKILNQS